MKQIKTYKYKLYNRDTTKHLDRIIDLSSCIYNHCIALHRRYYRLYKKQLNKYQLQKHLTKLKKLHEDTSSCAKIMGVKDIELYDFPDNRMDSVPLLDIVKKIEIKIEKRKRLKLKVLRLLLLVILDLRVSNQVFTTSHPIAAVKK